MQHIGWVLAVGSVLSVGFPVLGDPAAPPESRGPTIWLRLVPGAGWARDREQHRAVEFKTALYAPRTEAAVWSCMATATPVENLVGECKSNSGWYRGPGRYTLEVEPSDRSGLPSSITIDVQQGVERYNLHVYVDPRGSDLIELAHVARYWPAPPDVHMEPAWDPRVSSRPAYLLTNGRRTPLYSHHEGGRFFGLILRRAGDEWVYYARGKYNHAPERGGPLTPNETVVVTEHVFQGGKPSSTLEPGTYRFVVSFSFRPKDESYQPVMHADYFQVHREFTVAEGDVAATSR